MSDRRWLQTCGWTIGLFIFAATLGAEPQFEVSREPSGRMRIGETGRVTIQAIWSSREGEFLFQRPGLALERLAVEEMGESNETFQKAGEEWKKKTFQIVLRATEPGTGRVGPFSLNYLDPASQINGHYEVSAIEWKISRDFSRFLPWVAVSGLIFGGGVLGWIFFLRRRARRSVNQTLPVSIEERYANRLSEFEKESPESRVEQEQVSEAGRLFRAYLVEKYSITGNPMTHRELVERLRPSLSEAEVKHLARLFDTLEKWQYAQAERAPGAGRELCREMTRYVEGKKAIGV